VPRRGLDAGRVAEAAATIADRDGLAAVTLAAVAARLGVRSPSLYHHVDGRDGLLRLVALRALRELAQVLRTAAVGRAGADALGAAAHAYRRYAREHPGRYAATLAAPRPGEDDLRDAAAETIAVLQAILTPLGVRGDDAVHAIRAWRSAVHGFVTLEAAGGFGLPADRDASFARLIGLLAAGLASPTLSRGGPGRPARPPGPG